MIDESYASIEFSLTMLTKQKLEKFIIFLISEKVVFIDSNLLILGLL